MTGGLPGEGEERSARVPSAKTSAASATTTSRSMAGAARRSITFPLRPRLPRRESVTRLERNYRSTGHILAAASTLIAHNEGRLGKTLRTEDVDGRRRCRSPAPGTPEEEARAIGEEIEQMQRDAARDRGGGSSARRNRHPGARLVPDARIRRTLHPARPAAIA